MTGKDTKSPALPVAGSHDLSRARDVRGANPLKDVSVETRRTG
ncbi:MAG TPA: hypothetical protein VMW47_01295 [Verrucomicrobiae bacterium]|nr:hypothetical protein [Verrucomicrobiae bacterium]